MALVAGVLAGTAAGVGLAVESGSSKPARLSSRQLINAARAQANDRPGERVGGKRRAARNFASAGTF